MNETSMFCLFQESGKNLGFLQEFGKMSTFRWWKRELFINKYVATLSCMFMVFFKKKKTKNKIPKEYGNVVFCRDVVMMFSICKWKLK